MVTKAEQVVGMLLTFAFGVVFGAAICGWGWRKDIIDHGAAKWTVDPRTGVTRLEWLTDQPHQ